jgi:hypothetical protein
MGKCPPQGGSDDLGDRCSPAVTGSGVFTRRSITPPDAYPGGGTPIPKRTMNPGLVSSSTWYLIWKLRLVNSLHPTATSLQRDLNDNPPPPCPAGRLAGCCRYWQLRARSGHPSTNSSTLKADIDCGCRGSAQSRRGHSLMPLSHPCRCAAPIRYGISPLCVKLGREPHHV